MGGLNLAEAAALRQAISGHDQSDGRAHALHLALHRTEVLKRNLEALADQIFGVGHQDNALLSALRHHLSRELTADEISAAQQGEFPASLQLANLPEAA